MKTRYDLLQSAGDHVDSALKLIRQTNDSDIEKQVRTLLGELYEARDTNWNEAFAEPDLEEVA
jgi:hypothetical protein